MKIVDGFCLRELLGETIAVPTGAAAEHLSGLVSLNETGAFLFRLLQSEQSRQDLVSALLDAYEVDEATAQKDVTTFLEIMEKNRLLSNAPPGGKEGCQ